MDDTPIKRPGRPARPGGPTDLARRMNVDRRSSTITMNLALNDMQAHGDAELADEIFERLKGEAERPSRGRGDRTWMSAVEHIARFRTEDQRWAWEQVQTHGVRWLKRFIETQNSPPDAGTLAERIAMWLDREYPRLDVGVRIEALEAVASALKSARAEGPPSP
jgi:hypothetical protein